MTGVGGTLKRWNCLARSVVHMKTISETRGKIASCDAVSLTVPMSALMRP
jgi:hypothetical protein